MSTPWWTGLAPTAVEITCGADTHELRWADGVLSAPAHADVERERALMALGGESSACLSVLDGWLRHSRDLDVLLLAGRGPGDDVVAPRQDGGWWSSGSRRHRHVTGRQGWTGYSALSSHLSIAQAGDEHGAVDLEQLLQLDGGLPHRLAATVIAHWADRMEAGDAAVERAVPRLQAALYGRLMHAIRIWRGSTRHIDVVMASPGAEPAVTRAGQRVQIAVPFSWLRDVWVRGIATTFGRLCLSAVYDGQTWELRVVDLVDRDLGQTRLMTISLS